MRLALLAFAVLAFAVGCGGGDDESVGATTITSGDGCQTVAAPEPRAPDRHKAPTVPLEDGRTYALTFETNCGSFTVTLDSDLAPNAAASLVALAQANYFDNTLFHRIVPGFVIQGGDPKQDGTGGPGYSTVDLPPSDAVYTKGTVGMAKSRLEPPGTAGSQFFVVTGDTGPRKAEYAIAGGVTDGLDVVELIGTLGNAEEQPTQPVVISNVTSSVTVTDSG